MAKKYKKKYKGAKGTNSVPRLCVSRSNSSIHSYLINDCKNEIIAHVSSRDINGGKKNCNKQDSILVGKKIGEIIIGFGIKKVYFDRNGYLFHGKVKAIADGVNSMGVSF